MTCISPKLGMDVIHNRKNVHRQLQCLYIQPWLRKVGIHTWLLNSSKGNRAGLKLEARKMAVFHSVLRLCYSRAFKSTMNLNDYYTLHSLSRANPRTGKLYPTVSALPKLTIITARRHNINFVPMKLAGICVSVSQATGHYWYSKTNLFTILVPAHCI